jgi:hypothetical protein
VAQRGEVVRVVALFEDASGRGFMHVQRYMGSLQTVLGEWGNPHEVFRVDECATLPIEAIVEFKIVVRDASVWSERSRNFTLPLLERVAERLEKEQAAARDTEGAVKTATQRRQQRDETDDAVGTTTVDVADDTGLIAPPGPGPSARVSTDDADADGPQMASVAAMGRAIGGDAWWRRERGRFAAASSDAA